ncbi:MAG: dienelactone hydrolase family protein [Acidobacteria bacterium]|nr:dienelactone hydrolase family protein [Acidobacteriota bacterium]
MRRVAAALLLSALAFAGEPVTYQDGETRLAGYFAAPKGRNSLPAVVIIHQWMGPTDHERRVADELAAVGYAAFVADIYGETVRPKDSKEAGAQAGKFLGDRALYRQRIAAALEALKARKEVNPLRLGVIGYCFGGTGALEAARAGMPVKGVVSFHGMLGAGPGPVPSITAKVLACHGADDPYVPPKDVAAFQAEMKQAKADYVFVAYAGAVHAFTQKEAGDDPSRGAAYHEKAMKRSWGHMLQFLSEALVGK